VRIGSSDVMSSGPIACTRPVPSHENPIIWAVCIDPQYTHAHSPQPMEDSLIVLESRIQRSPESNLSLSNQTSRPSRKFHAKKNHLQCRQISGIFADGP
jgi:hypothetical protein